MENNITSLNEDLEKFIKDEDDMEYLFLMLAKTSISKVKNVIEILNSYVDELYLSGRMTETIKINKTETLKNIYILMLKLIINVIFNKVVIDMNSITKIEIEDKIKKIEGFNKAIETLFDFSKKLREFKNNLIITYSDEKSKKINELLTTSEINEMKEKCKNKGTEKCDGPCIIKKNIFNKSLCNFNEKQKLNFKLSDMNKNMI